MGGAPPPPPPQNPKNPFLGPLGPQKAQEAPWESLGTIRTHSDPWISMWTHQTTSHSIYEKFFFTFVVQFWTFLEMFVNKLQNPKTKSTFLMNTKVVPLKIMCRMPQ